MIDLYEDPKGFFVRHARWCVSLLCQSGRGCAGKTFGVSMVEIHEDPKGFFARYARWYVSLLCQSGRGCAGKTFRVSMAEIQTMLKQGA